MDGEKRAERTLSTTIRTKLSPKNTRSTVIVRYAIKRLAKGAIKQKKADISHHTFCVTAASSDPLASIASGNGEPLKRR